METSPSLHVPELVESGKKTNFPSTTDYPRWIELQRRQGLEYRETAPLPDSEVVSQLQDDRIMLIGDSLNAKPSESFISVKRSDIFDLFEDAPLPRDKELPELGLLIEDQYKHWMDDMFPKLPQMVAETDLSISKGHPVAEVHEVLRRTGQATHLLERSIEYTDAQLLRFMFYTYFRDPLRITEDSVEGSLMSVGLALAAIDRRSSRRQLDPLSYEQLHEIVISPEFNKVLRGLAYTKNSFYRNSPGNGMDFPETRRRLHTLESNTLGGRELVSLDENNRPYVDKTTRNRLIGELKALNETGNPENNRQRLLFRRQGLLRRVGNMATHSVRIPTGDAEIVASKSSGCPVIHRSIEIGLLTDAQLDQLEQDGIGERTTDESGAVRFMKKWDSIDATCQLVAGVIDLLAA